MNCLFLICRSKQSKIIYACLAQSVEHAAVNRSVGGPSPSTGAKQTTQTSGFFVIHYWKSDTHTFGVWRYHRHCGTALGVSFMCASTPTTLFIGG